MTAESQLRQDQGSAAFKFVNKAVLSQRPDSMKYPAWSALPTHELVEQAVAAHKKKLDDERLAAEAAFRGERPVAADRELDPPTSFQAGGLSLLGGGAAEQKKRKLAPPIAPKTPASASAAGGRKNRFASGSNGAAVTDAGSGAAVAGSPPSSRVALDQSSAEDWKKIDPQDILDGRESVGKKLNGVFRILFVIV